MHGSSPAAEIARSPAAWERLAKSWLVEVIERSPLAEVDDLPLAPIAQDAAPLIAEILGQLSDPGAARDLVLSPAAIERAGSLGAGRDPAAVIRRLPRELSALQSLLVEAIDRELLERDRREFARAVGRLAEVFGAVQAAALDPIASALAPAAASAPEAVDDPTGDDLDLLLGELAAEAARTGEPFTLAHFEVEGVERISKGYGEGAAALMVDAVEGVLDEQLADSERSFRMGLGRILALVPGEAVSGVDLATRVGEVIETSQSVSGPRVEVAVGIASYPRHGTEPDELLEAAEEAAWAARAAGETVALARPRVLQDP
ncbi:MAG: diguanylate cyclase [Solirubrobacterales bacterium]